MRYGEVTTGNVRRLQVDDRPGEIEHEPLSTKPGFSVGPQGYVD